MGKLKTVLMSQTMDDMGPDDCDIRLERVSELVDASEIEDAHNDWLLSKYTTEQLQKELDKRGWKVISK